MQNHATDLATTKMFWRAVCQALESENVTYYRQYTDVARPRTSTNNRRYCAMLVNGRSWDPEFRDRIVERIEFQLWAQGVTAKTRITNSALRGTCVIER